MKRLFIIIGLIAAATSVKSQRADNPDLCDKEFLELSKPVYDVSEDTTAIRLWGSGSSKYLTWEELRKRQFRDLGTEFFEKYPVDSRFDKWYLNTSLYFGGPAYWENAEQGGHARIYPGRCTAVAKLDTAGNRQRELLH